MAVNGVAGRDACGIMQKITHHLHFALTGNEKDKAAYTGQDGAGDGDAIEAAAVAYRKRCAIQFVCILQGEE